MKRILVPTDLSEIAERGLRLAVDIGKRCGATISLVNFTRHPLGRTFSTTGEADLQASEEESVFNLELLRLIKEKMEALAVRYAVQGVSIDYEVVDSKFSSGVDALMSRGDIDLIVMGTSGEETAKEAFTGNHTQRAIKISPCPVLSVRDEYMVDQFKNIVAAVTVITDNQMADGLTTLKSLADCFDSTIHLVHVRLKTSESNILLNEYFERMARIAKLERYTVNIIDAEDLATGVLEFASKVNAGLVSVLRNRDHGIFRIFSNHFAGRIIKEEGIPVVTLNVDQKS